MLTYEQKATCYYSSILVRFIEDTKYQKLTDTVVNHLYEISNDGHVETHFVSEVTHIAEQIIYKSDLPVNSHERKIMVVLLFCTKMIYDAMSFDYVDDDGGTQLLQRMYEYADVIGKRTALDNYIKTM
jgi:hypothetical protein